jgi:hypothetical protein
MNAETRIYEKMNNQLYKKVGNKYVPINDPYAYDGLREGWWLLKVKPGSTSIRQLVRPATAEFQAAIRDKEEQLVDIICKASEARPQNIPISEQAKKDWEWFISRNGKEFNMLEYPSIQENAEKIIEALLDKKYEKI